MSFERRPALTHEILTQLGLIILFVDGKVRHKKNAFQVLETHSETKAESQCKKQKLWG
jgi:hypothetical protein